MAGHRVRRGVARDSASGRRLPALRIVATIEVTIDDRAGRSIALHVRNAFARHHPFASGRDVFGDARDSIAFELTHKQARHLLHAPPRFRPASHNSTTLTSPPVAASIRLASE